jgi:hypothetical protein
MSADWSDDRFIEDQVDRIIQDDLSPLAKDRQMATTAVSTNEWTWGCDTPCWTRPRRTIFFIYRQAANGVTEYLNDARGRLRQWESRDAVKKALADVQRKKDL